MKVCVPVVVTLVLILVLLRFFEKSISEETLIISEVSKGDIEATTDASGKIIPAYEETVVSPVSTRIMEVYCREGDVVEAGTPLMRLDLRSVEKDVRNLSDELGMKRNSTRQAALNSHTFLTNLEMKIEAKEMSVGALNAEADNERRLDSLGSGTGERVRQAELAYRTGLIELAQLKKELENERQAQAAANRSKELDEGITATNLELLRHTLEDAQIVSPIAATVTFINSAIGSSIGTGEKLVVLADLTKFKITADMPEGERDKLSPGGKAIIRIGNHRLFGTVTQVRPESSNGVVTFTVKPDNESDPLLGSGLRATVSVVYDLLPDVLRIQNGQYYKGPGRYRMFVFNSSGELEKREIMLGGCNFEWVEVKSGLKQGEKVAINDMSDFSQYSGLKVRKRK